MSSTITKLRFRGKYFDFTDEELQDVIHFQSEGETLEQTLERVIIEAEEERRLDELKKAGTLDYFIHAYPMQ